MKKNLLTWMGIGALILGSCSSEEPVIPDDNSGNVVFTASLPSQMVMSRSTYDDGLTATNLDYAVYDAAGNNLTGLNGTATFNERKTQVTLNLVTGKTYTVVFWASAPDAPYTFNAATAEVTVTTTGNANDKKRDAFFASETFTVTGSINKTIELKRPFAQINIGTNDLTDFTNAGGTISKSGITVKAPNVLNLIDGTVEGEAEYVFTTADFLSETEMFPVTTTPAQRWLSTAFILADANKTTVDVKWTSDNNTPGHNAVDFTFIPIQRNYRTNIYGTLLTSPTKYNISINNEFEMPDYNYVYPVVETADDFKTAVIEDGGAIVPEGTTINLSEIMPAGVDDESFAITKPTTIVVEGELKADNAAQLQVKSHITLVGSQQAATMNSRATEVRGGVITGGPRGIFYLREGGSLTADNITFNTPDAYRGGDIWNEGGGDVTLTNCTFNSQMASVFFLPASDDAVITIKNCVVNNTSRNSIIRPDNGQSAWSYAIRIVGGVANISDNVMTGIQGVISADGGVVNIYSGTYSTHNSDGKNDAFYAVYTCTSGECNIYGGDFYSPRQAVYNGNNDTTDIFGKAFIYGGRFSHKAWDQQMQEEIPLPNGYEWQAIEEDELYKWTVVKKTAE